jgi:hypothetical protein
LCGRNAGIRTRRLIKVQPGRAAPCQCDIQCDTKTSKAGHTRTNSKLSGESKETSLLARSGSRYPGRWLWGVESNHQPVRSMRSRNPRQHGILSISPDLSDRQCDGSVTDGMGEPKYRPTSRSKLWQTSPSKLHEQNIFADGDRLLSAPVRTQFKDKSRTGRLRETSPP